MYSNSYGIQGIVLLAACSLLAACAGEPPRPSPRTAAAHPTATPAAAPRSISQEAALVAVHQLGAPYRYGGSNERGFDCSGLVHYAYRKAGRSLPRTTGGLWQQLEPVTARNLRVGDVLFFDIEGKISHVGLYLGAQRFVHAPASGREVSIAKLDSDYYRQAFVRGGRPR